ncbi:hypothetical protein D4764_19G0000800 [Takifugu flavidus]|uniref:Uncharacterized protein n=1 Tax=Takifugu flavidus TaxID=433684 RepID=A0A5C6NL33_9TELE|nr:hypothetical protein D4764_19G0000800 [Takifugu flavidus]
MMQHCTLCSHTWTTETYAQLPFADFSSAFNTAVPPPNLETWASDFLTNRPKHVSPVHGSNSIIKFVDNTTGIGIISNNDETAYTEVVQYLTTRSADNYLLVNTSKTKELKVDFRKARGDT